MSSKFKVFKTLTVGGLRKEALLNQLIKHGIEFNDYAKTLFDDPHFSTSETTETVSTVKVNLSDLGLTKPSVYSEIIIKAEERGLKLCALSLAAHLRLEFLEQAEGPYITVASVKPMKDESYPNGLYVRNLDNKLWLRGYRATDDYQWPIESEFVFRVDA